MITRHFTRYFYTKSSLWAAEKSQLAALRKKTGYTFSNCKKALELHNNDLNKAEVWLKEQAQALGWSKATKLEGRQTTQGLIAVLVHKNDATLVELNCETDFVARNEMFKTMAGMAAKTCLNYAENINDKQSISKVLLSGNELKLLKASDGKTLADHVALMIGSVGENASLKRALCFKTRDDLHLYGYAHPSGNKRDSVLLGRLGGVVALERVQNYDDVDLSKVGKDLCQHIVGMSPKRIGDENVDVPAKNIDDEECLIYQEYINDNSILVKDYLDETGVKVVDFKRIECGERDIIDDRLDTIETCQ